MLKQVVCIMFSTAQTGKTSLGSALYWVATQHRLVGGTDRLSRNVGNQLPIYSVTSQKNGDLICTAEEA